MSTSKEIYVNRINVFKQSYGSAFLCPFYAPERNIFLFTNNIAEFQRNFKKI